MRGYVKTQCFKRLSFMEETHDRMARNIAKKHMDEWISFLEECQQTAIEIGTTIEKSEGEGTEAVRILEEYCEVIYQAHEELAQGKEINGKRFEKKAHRLLSRVKTEIQDVIPTQYEVVFLPYKASMWDSLESVWKAADADPNCTAYVIPIPYYDKNPDGSYARLHYEIDEFPEDVPVMKYRDYDFAKRHPDRIYIHNPYDKYNYVTEIQRDFFSDNLKKWTDGLVYIPYFVYRDDNLEIEEARNNVAHFVMTPGVINADRIYVQSKKMRTAYIQVLMERFGKEKRKYWEKTISGIGSPKYDRLIGMKRVGVSFPDEWQKHVVRSDGTRRKVILYNTGLNSLLEYGEEAVLKIKEVFQEFKQQKDAVVCLWRPHPLIESTIAAMRPFLWEIYKTVLEDFKQEDIGIYDDTADVDRAIVLSDAYYGDWSSLVLLCRRIGMPTMIQHIDKNEGINV